MYSYADDLVVDQLYYGMFDEFYELKLTAELAVRYQYFFDIGANTGVYSLLISTVAKHSIGYAFEPYKSNADRFRYNMTCNKIGHLNIFEIAISDHDGEISFYVPKGRVRISQVSSVNEAFSSAHKQNDVEDFEEIRIPVLTLDSFVKREAIPHIDFIKIDVESLEIEVLRGGMNSISRFRPFILCELFYRENTRIFIESLLFELDYSMYTITKEGLIRTRSISNAANRNYFLVPGNRDDKFGWDELYKL
jgi:FkbM family methyltransferase